MPFLQKLPTWPVLAVFTVIIIVIWSTQLAGYYSTPLNQDWRSSTDFLKKTVKSGDIIIVMPDYNKVPFNYYFDNANYGTIQINMSSVKEKVNTGPVTCNTSVFIVVTTDLLSVDLSGESVRWLSTQPVLLGNFNGVYVGKLPIGC